MAIAVSAVVALGSGVVSFLAPCTVPLLPAYVGVLSGSSAGVPEEQQAGRLLRGSLLYVLGFTVVFVTLGVGAGGLGHAVRDAGGPVPRAGGVVVLQLAAALVLEPRLGLLSRAGGGAGERRGAVLRRTGVAAPFLLGVVFATAFTPCVGPFLAAVLTLAAGSGGAVSGGVLLAAYALGLGLPFVVTALAVAGTPGLARRLARVAGPVSVVGGVALAVLGLTLVFGHYDVVSGWLARFSPA